MSENQRVWPIHAPLCDGCGGYHGGVNAHLSCLVHHLRLARERAALVRDFAAESRALFGERLLPGKD